MKKRFFFVTVVFALAGLLFLTGCPTDGGDKKVTVKKTALKDKIAEAKAEQANTEVAADGSQLSPGLVWVTQPVMDTFEDAIASAERVYKSSKSSQSAVNSAVKALNNALTFFKAARQPGTGARHNSVTISGFDTTTYPNGSGIQVGLFATADDASPVSTPEIYGSGEIQNGAVTVDLFLSSGNTPWAGDGSWFVGFMVSTDEFQRAFISKNPVSFTASNPNPGIIFSNFNEYDFQPIGTITGTITLTDIPNPPPEVYISASEYSEGPASWSSDSSRISMSGVTGSTATLNWSIPIYENNGFVRGSTQFRLWVRPAGSSDGFSVLPENVYVSSPNADVGSLGTFSIAFVTLSGMITVTNNGNPVPRVEIDVYGDYSGWVGSTRLTSPGTDAPWSIMIPPFDQENEIYFHIVGYTSNGDRIFYEYYEPDPAIIVFNQDRSGISLRVAVQTVTLSGTITATYDGDRVPRVEISVYGYNEQQDEYINEYIRLNSPNANAPWTIMIPALSSPTVLTFTVVGNTNDGEEIFYREDIATRTVSNQNVSGISLSVEVQAVTLSGTLNVTYGGKRVPHVQISVWGYNDGSYISSYTSLSSPGASAPWSIKVPVPASPVEVGYFAISGYSNSGFCLFDESYYLESPITVSNTSIPGIVIDLEDYPNYFEQPSNATPLTNGVWANGNINDDGRPVSYSFTATAGQTYYVWWNDYDGDGTYTMNVKVRAYDSDGFIIFDGDNGWDYSQEVSGVSGTVYLVVYPYSSDSTGNFAIAYRNTDSRPTP